MNPRERVMLALNHREPDRVPIDLGATIVSSITKRAYADLTKCLNMPLEGIHVLDIVQQLPYLDEALLRRFGVDFRMVCLPPALAPLPHIWEVVSHAHPALPHTGERHRGRGADLLRDHRDEAPARIPARG